MTMSGKFDYLVVGAGLFGSVFAREAIDAGRSVLVIDQRDHIGGNVYTKPMHGIQVHQYGPHIFHTNHPSVWSYMRRFAQFNHYSHRVKVRYDDTIYSFPINLLTLHQLWGVTSPAEAEARLARERIPCENPTNLEDWILSQVGREIYEKFIRGYTMKQWQRDPKALPASIIRRLPIRLTFDDNYYKHAYQGIPIGGYTGVVQRMLEGIEVRTGTSFASLGHWRKLAKKLVFTGKIDEFFDYRFGDLEYRSLRFEHEVHDGDYQGLTQMNYGSPAVPFTRIVEHKHFEFGTQPRTVITKEYAIEGSRQTTPYYPINDEGNSARYARYLELARETPDVIFGGRLGSYKYYDMDQVVAAALVASAKALGVEPKLGRDAEPG